MLRASALPVVLALVVVGGGPAAPALARTAERCAVAVPLAAIIARMPLACDARESWVQHGDLRVGVPEPGHFVKASSLGMTRGEELLVLRFADGSIQGSADPPTLLRLTGLDAPVSTAVAYPPPVPDPDQPSCYESSYTHESYKRTSQTYEWIYDPGIETSPVTRVREPYPNVIADILQGAMNMTTGVNPCLLAPIVGLSEQWVLYDPAAEGLFTGPGDCDNDARSGNDIVDWGDLPGIALAVTCASGFITFLGIRLQPIETDVRFDADQPWLSPDEQALLLSGSRECPRQAWDVQSVTVHEFGHVWGLDHSADYDQTMYPTIPPCDLSKRDLGYGDYLGLATKYPLPPNL
jgi:hypothetical protein